ncbi:MAG: BREX system P-loop protein BrxC [Deltaproteobacteria bacterium]|nr:BREX system P-loop protein BrxC [Deltaproteobacteria bacterium]
MQIGSLFDVPVRERIEPVVKVEDRSDERLLVAELDGTVITAPAERFLAEVLGAYGSTLGGATSDVGVWLSGPFGSGKSHLAKLLSLAVEGAELGGATVATRLLARLSPRSKRRPRIAESLAAMERAPSATLCCQLAAQADDEGASLARVLLGALYRRRGYSGNVLYAQALEAAVDRQGELDRFRQRVEQIAAVPFEEIRRAPAAYHRALCEAAAAVAPQLFATPQAAEEAVERARTGELCSSDGFVTAALAEVEAAGRSRLLVVLDEAGPWAKRHRGRLAELGALVEQAAHRGRGRLWVVAVAHEDLPTLRQAARDPSETLESIESRFRFRLPLSSESIAEVVEQRLLLKTPPAQDTLEQIYRARGGALRDVGELRAVEPPLPDCSQERFVRTYPLLPYQLPLGVEVVRSLRAEAGRPELLAGSTRTLLGIVQDVLCSGRRSYLTAPVGQLVSLDEVYRNLAVAGEVPAALGADDGGTEPADPGWSPATRRVAEVLYLLRLVPGVPATADNVARLLATSCDQDLLELVAQTEPELERLAASRLVARIGDRYEWLVGAARELERAAAAAEQALTDADRRAAFWRELVQRAGEAHFTEWLGPATVALAGRRFGFKLRIDGRAVRGRRGDVSLEVTTGLVRSAVGPAYADLGARSREPEARATMYLLLGEDDELPRTLDRFVALEQVLSAWSVEFPAASAEADAARQRRAEQLPRTRREVLAALDRALGRATLWFRGDPIGLEPAVGEAARDALRRVVTGCFRAVYTKLERVPVRIRDEQPILAALLAGARATGATIAELRLYDEQGRLDSAAPLLDAIRIVLAAKAPNDASGAGLGGQELCATLAAPPYGWDPKTVWVGAVALCCAGRVRFDHPDGRSALGVRKAFERGRLRLAADGSTAAELTAARSLLIELTGRRRVDETVPAVSAAARRLADRVLATAEAALLWHDGRAEQPAAAALEGVRSWRELARQVEPDRRVRQLAQDATALRTGRQAIEALLEPMPARAVERVRWLASRSEPEVDDR